MTPREAYEDMLTRCAEVVTLMRNDDINDGLAPAVGALIQTHDDGFLAVEIGQDATGMAFVSATAYTPNGRVRPAMVLEVNGSVMVTA